MIGKLICKILLKATLPLAAMIGISSYMLYMNGGDPLKLLKMATGGVGSQASGLLDSARENSQAMLDGIQDGIGGDGEAAPARSPTVYRWVDAGGSTHFGTSPPTDARQVVQMSVDPDRNVIPTRKVSQQAAPVNNEIQEQRLPGAAGMKLPGGMDPEALLEAVRGR